MDDCIQFCGPGGVEGERKTGLRGGFSGGFTRKFITVELARMFKI